MKKILFIIFCLITFSVSIQAENETPVKKGTDANITGHVVDKATGEHMPYISVVIKGTTIGTTTDATGHYFLSNLPVGKFVLEVSSIGYKTEKRDINIEKGKTLEINFELSEDLVALDGVVVSANRSETTRRLAPTLVNVLDAKLFNTTNACTLADGLNYQPGVRVETNCQNCGFQQVRINGLDGPYTQILIDSRPVFSALAGVYGIEQIPASMIERVEVMRGGGSALFGASAVAGTINIITKEPLRNTGTFSHSLMSIGGTGALDNNTSANASLVTDDNKAGLYVFAQNRHRDSYDHDGDGFSEIPTIKSQTLGFRSYIKTSLYTKLTAEYHHIQEYRRGGDSISKPAHHVWIAEEIKHSIDCAGLKFDYFSPDSHHRLGLYTSMQNIRRNTFYGGGKTDDGYGTTKGLTYMVGTQYIYSFDNLFFMPSDLTAGAEYTYDRLNDVMEGYGRSITQAIHVGSAFLQNEWKNDKWGILLGVRMDKHSLLKKPVFSPRANFRFNPTPNINLRASYSSGFRAPQIFDEDLHIENVVSGVKMIQNSPDLKEERSHSISLSADTYKRVGDFQLNFLVEGFFNRLKDVFSLDGGVQKDGMFIYTRTNEKAATVAGALVEAKLAYKSLAQLQAGFTYQKAKFDNAVEWFDGVTPEKRMFRTPDMYGYMTATVSPLRGFDISLSGVYTGKMLVQHVLSETEAVAVETPQFFDMGLKLAYDFDFYKSMCLQLNAGVQNIFNAFQKDFDKGKDRDSGYMYGPSLPRSFFAGIKLSF